MKAYRTYFRPESMERAGDGAFPFMDCYTRRKPTFRLLRSIIRDRIKKINELMAADNSETDYNSLAGRRVYLKNLLNILPEAGEACQDNMPIAGQTRIMVREIDVV